MKLLSILILISAAVPPVANAQTSARMATRAEASNYKMTASYEETISYCKELAKRSPHVRYSPIGSSPQGRDLPLLIVSRDGKFDPEPLETRRRPVVLVINGIHSGEIAGKEASLQFLRDVLVLGEHPTVLDSVTLLVVPIFNVDGHERSGPFNRINQNGPSNMGWRTTAQNYNLNRDFLKADSPEMRSLLGVIGAWAPDFFIDNHVTDGADFQYDMLVAMESDTYVTGPTSTYSRGFYDKLRRDLGQLGHLVETYFVLVDGKDLRKGIARYEFSPRFSNGYAALRNRPSILVEAHMLKPFETRVRSTYSVLHAALRGITTDPDALLAANRAADRATVEAARDDERHTEPLDFDVAPEPGTIDFKGVEFRHEPSPISGVDRVVYGTKPTTLAIPFFNRFATTASTTVPKAYAIPPEWTVIIDRLKLHGIRFNRLTSPLQERYETYRFSDPQWQRQPFENHHRVRYTIHQVEEDRILPKGTVIVPLDQPLARLAIHLLEPAGVDSLVSWGYFDAIFEQKEYGEAYVLEKLARDMLDADPKLRRQFEKRLEADAQFKADPYARLNFFYTRSPYWDARLNAYPVVRIRDLEPIRSALESGR